MDGRGARGPVRPPRGGAPGCAGGCRRRGPLVGGPALGCRRCWRRATRRSGGRGPARRAHPPSQRCGVDGRVPGLAAFRARAGDDAHHHVGHASRPSGTPCSGTSGLHHPCRGYPWSRRHHGACWPGHPRTARRRSRGVPARGVRPGACRRLLPGGNDRSRGGNPPRGRRRRCGGGRDVVGRRQGGRRVLRPAHLADRLG